MNTRFARWALAAIVFSSSAVLADDFENPKANIPPKAAPQRRNGGEGMVPLPGPPVTPLRRSEKKREPSPPALLGNLTFSDTAIKKNNLNWQTTVIDIEEWVHFTNDKLGQRYRFVNTDFSKFSYDPGELPILYFTGWKPIPELDAKTLDHLRQYLMDGGTLVVHSNCGRKEFNDSFRDNLANRLFQDRQLAAIPTDHPIYSAFYKITQMHVRKGKDPFQETKPYLETINIGTRAAVIFSPIDLSCGWDAEANPIEGGILYKKQDALELGSNIMTYCLAEFQYGRFFDHQKVYHQAKDATRDQLVLGQIVHNGDWDPTPHGLPNLLKAMDQNTTLKVQFKREPVDPAKGNIFSFPVLYMVGQRAFDLDDVACKRLREYLDNGGTLVVDDAIGNSDFNGSFQKVIKKIYPDHPLAAIRSDHPLLTFVYDTRSPALAPLGKQLHGGGAPQLQVIEFDGSTPVVYSRLSMSAGWEQLPRAYNDGYADDDALKLGTNVFLYEASH